MRNCDDSGGFRAGPVRHLEIVGCRPVRAVDSVRLENEKCSALRVHVTIFRLAQQMHEAVEYRAIAKNCRTGLESCWQPILCGDRRRSDGQQKPGDNEYPDHAQSKVGPKSLLTLTEG